MLLLLRMRINKFRIFVSQVAHSSLVHITANRRNTKSDALMSEIANNNININEKKKWNIKKNTHTLECILVTWWHRIHLSKNGVRSKNKTVCNQFSQRTIFYFCFLLLLCFRSIVFACAQILSNVQCARFRLCVLLTKKNFFFSFYILLFMGTFFGWSGYCTVA